MRETMVTRMLRDATGAAETKKPPLRAVFRERMVPEIGIEPTTYALRMRRSTD
jgi:hypothetical protein